MPVTTLIILKVSVIRFEEFLEICCDPVVFDISDYEVNLSAHPQCKVLELCMIRAKKLR